MKHILLILVIVYYTLSYSQEHLNNSEFLFSKYETENINQIDYIKRIRQKISKNDSIFIVELNNKKILEFESKSITLYKFDDSLNLIYKKRVNDENNILNNSLKDLFTINPTKLNVVNNGQIHIEVNDGFNYKISVFKSNKALFLSSYSPETYIENQFLFYEKRQFFLEIFQKLNNLFYDEEFNKIKNALEVFIKIDHTKIVKKKNQKMIYLGNNYFVYNCKSKTQKIRYFKNKEFIDFDYLKQFSNNEIKVLLKNNKKKIFFYYEALSNKKTFKYDLYELKLIL